MKMITAAALKAGHYALCLHTEYDHFYNLLNPTGDCAYFEGGMRAARSVLRSITATIEADLTTQDAQDILDELVNLAADALIFGRHTLGLDFDLCPEYWAIKTLLQCRPWRRYYA